MSQCWLPVPLERPSYGQAKEKIGAQLKQCCKYWYDDLMALLQDRNNENEYVSMRQSITGISTETEGREMPKIGAKKVLDNRIYFNQPTLTAEEAVEMAFIKD